MWNGAKASVASVKYGAHSDVERLSEAALYRVVEFGWNVVSEIAVKK